MRRVVSEMAELMEARFAKFDGIKRMSSDDDWEESLIRAQEHLNDAYEMIGEPEFTDDDLMQKVVDAANRLALVIFTMNNGVTDEGVNE